MNGDKATAVTVMQAP